MITEKENIHISKFLSVLRHKPETIGITLDENGWTDVQQLIEQLNSHGMQIDREVLKHVVSTNSKKRFSFSDDGTKVRANQGHSVGVDLLYKPGRPPELLYHGTAERFLSSIVSTGIQKMARHHVHLSANIETATQVGQRHGKPVVLQVRALDMFNDGYQFFVTDNQVWLTEHVPVVYTLEVPG